MIWLRKKWRQTEHRPELLTHSDSFSCLELELKLNHYFEVSGVFDLELNCFQPAFLQSVSGYCS